MPTVFLSYAWADKEFVRNLRQGLARLDVGVWIDEQGLRVGDTLPSGIAEAIDRVDFFLIVLSPFAVSSPWVARELGHARRREYESRSPFILVANRASCPLPGEFAFLEERIWADFRPECDFDTALGQISSTIHEYGRHLRRFATAPLQSTPAPSSVAYVMGSRPPSGRHIVSLMDAATNYDAAKAIAETLRFVMKLWQLRLVLVEGGTGDVSLSYLRQRGSREIRVKVAEEYLTQGLISGEEYLDIVTDDPLILYGVDDPQNYDRAIRTRRTAVEIRERTQPVCTLARHHVMTLLRAEVTGPAARLMEAVWAFEADGAISKLLPVLLDGCESGGIGLGRYPNVSAFKMAAELERGLAPPMDTGRERTAAIASLRQYASRTDLDDIDAIVAGIRGGILEPELFHQALSHLLTKYGLWSESFPLLRAYCAYNDVRQQVDDRSFMEEIDQLVDDLLHALPASGYQRQLVHAGRLLDLAAAAAQMRLLPESYEKYRHHRGSLEWSAEFLEGMMRARGMAYEEGGLSRVIEAAAGVVPFYNSVCERALGMADAVVEAMDRKGEGRAALITVGFLSPYVNRCLLAKGERVVPIMPKFDSVTDRATFEKVLAAKHRHRSRQGPR